MWLDKWMQRLAILATVGFILLPHVGKAADSTEGFSFAALKAAGTRYEAHTYPDTQHGFHNNSTPRYNEAAAKLSWDRTIEHFKKHLA